MGHIWQHGTVPSFLTVTGDNAADFKQTNEQRSYPLEAQKAGSVRHIPNLKDYRNFQHSDVLTEETLIKMNKSELRSVLQSAEFDFERRFDERWAVEWMQEHW